MVRKHSFAVGLGRHLEQSSAQAGTSPFRRERSELFASAVIPDEQRTVRDAADRGDTLVEVLMAIVILSMVIVGAITVMSRGLKASQLAVEHTQVRLEINAQTEMLRYLRDSYSSDPTSAAGQTWAALFKGSPIYADTSPSNYSDTSCNVTSGKTGFYLTQTGGVVSANTFDPSIKPPTYALPGQGLWVEMTRSSGYSPAYVDVLLRACWSGIGDSADQQSVTAVRLYDPAH